VRAVVEEHRDDLAVFRGAGEAAGAAGVEGAFPFFLTQGQERAPVDVAVSVDHKFTVCEICCESLRLILSIMSFRV